MRILVTGGAGYIGSHTCVELLSGGYDVLILDNFSNSDRATLKNISRITKKNINVLVNDAREKKNVDAVFDEYKPDAVIHFAGSKIVTESIKKPIEYFENNIVSAINILRSMDKFKCKKIVFSSSANVYGDARSLPLTEKDKTNPISPYGRTKLMIERIIMDWQSTSKDKAGVALRYFNPVGAHPSSLIGEKILSSPNNIMPLLGQVAVGNLNYFSIFGNDYKTLDGTAERDYIHVVDLAKAHVSCLKYMTKSFGVFNVGTGRPTSVKRLIEMYELISKKEIPTKIKPRREGDITSSWADISKAKKILNWEARLDLEAMCRDAWNWHNK